MYQRAESDGICRLLPAMLAERRPDVLLIGRESFTRHVPSIAAPHVPRYINLADIVVLPLFGEGLARVYLETQACGRVLIASDTAPAREVVDDGVTGLLFPVGAVDALAERCIRAAQDAGLRARIGSAARERVRRHRIAAAVTRYLRALEAVARGPGSDPGLP